MGGVHRAFQAFRLDTPDVRGTACMALWSSLKPSTAATPGQLEALLTIEEVTSRFDSLCFQFQQPLDSMLETRASCARVLSIASSAIEDLPMLVSAVREAILLQSSNVSSNDGVNPPHFYSVFRRLHEKFATLALNGSWTSPPQMTQMEMFAMIRTRDSTQTHVTSDDDPIRGKFRLLGSSITNVIDTSTDQYISASFEGTLLQELRTADAVSLARLDLLRSEI